MSLSHVLDHMNYKQAHGSVSLSHVLDHTNYKQAHGSVSLSYNFELPCLLACKMVYLVVGN